MDPNMADGKTERFDVTWAIVGFACVVGVLVYLHLTSSGASAGTAAASGALASCITFSFCCVACTCIISGLAANGVVGDGKQF